MNLIGLLMFVFIVPHEFKGSSATLLKRSPQKSVRLENFWTPKNSTLNGSTGRSSDNSGSSLTMDSSSSGRQTNLNRIPQVNFYSSIPNALGVIGQGIIWLREISAALGTPIPIWIFTIPFVILGVGLMFMPDLTQLQLPGFYPNGGGDGDPLAAFPPLPDMDDLSSLNIIRQLIPPKFMMERWG